MSAPEASIDGSSIHWMQFSGAPAGHEPDLDGDLQVAARAEDAQPHHLRLPPVGAEELG
jgi:hypothetical protein